MRRPQLPGRGPTSHRHKRGGVLPKLEVAGPKRRIVPVVFDRAARIARVIAMCAARSARSAFFCAGSPVGSRLIPALAAPFPARALLRWPPARPFYVGTARTSYLLER